jgi:quercetin dioxygenase-like cupin family protein
MNKVRIIIAAVLFSGVAIVSSSCTDKNRQETKGESNANLIFPQGEKITSENFTGTAYLNMLIDADSLNANSVGNVTFEAGARTRWHLHPAGQILLVTDGVGYYQEKGQSKKILRKGDVVKCPPDVPHWHGASADDAFVQIALTSRHNGPTVWLDEVTDEEYHK